VAWAYGAEGYLGLAPARTVCYVANLVIPTDRPDPAHALRLLPARLGSVMHFFLATSWLVSVSATSQVRITTKPNFRKRNPPFRPIETLVHTNTTC
jgi:hypothetical protein